MTTITAADFYRTWVSYYSALGTVLARCGEVQHPSYEQGEPFLIDLFYQGDIEALLPHVTTLKVSWPVSSFPEGDITPSASWKLQVHFFMEEGFTKYFRAQNGQSTSSRSSICIDLGNKSFTREQWLDQTTRTDIYRLGSLCPAEVDVNYIKTLDELLALDNRLGAIPEETPT